MLYPSELRGHFAPNFSLTRICRGRRNAKASANVMGAFAYPRSQSRDLGHRHPRSFRNFNLSVSSRIPQQTKRPSNLEEACG